MLISRGCGITKMRYCKLYTYMRERFELSMKLAMTFSPWSELYTARAFTASISFSKRSFYYEGYVLKNSLYEYSIQNALHKFPLIDQDMKSTCLSFFCPIGRELPSLAHDVANALGPCCSVGILLRLVLLFSFAHL